MTEAERQRDVLSSILASIADNRIIRISDNLGGEWKGFRYFFEGEDDLLHLAISRNEEGDLTVEEAQSVVSELLPGVPPALIWLKPGRKSHHFYVGHDDLASTLIL